MTDKVLLSMLAAAAIPAGAYADIDVTKTAHIDETSNWNVSGLGGVTATGNLLKGGSITVDGASAGSLEFPVSGLIAGATYKITAEGNNLALTVEGDGITHNDDGTFKSTKGAFKVVVKGEKLDDYSITYLRLDIVMDFKKIRDALTAIEGEMIVNGKIVATATVNAELTEITAKNQTDPDFDDKKHDYNTQAEPDKEVSLLGRIKEVSDKLDSLTVDNESDAKVAIGIYGSLGLDAASVEKDESGATIISNVEQTEIGKIITNLVADIAEHNYKVGVQNSLSANWESNKAQYVTQLKAANAYNDTVSALEYTGKEFETSTWAATQKAVDAFNVAYAAYATNSDCTLKALLVDTDEVTVATAEEKLKELMDAAVEENTKAENDVNAYAQVQDSIAALEKEYTKLYNYFMGLRGNYGSEEASAIALIKTNAVNALKKRKELGAFDHKDEDQQTYADAIADMRAKQAGVDAAVTASDSVYTAQTGKLTPKLAADTIVKGSLADYQLQIDTLSAKINKELEDINSQKTSLQDDVQAINKAIADAQKKADTAWEEYKNVGESIAQNLADIQSAIDKINGDDKGSIAYAKKAQKTWEDNKAALDECNATLAEAHAKLVEASAECAALLNTLKGENEEDVAEGVLVQKYAVAYKAIYQAINGDENGEGGAINNNNDQLRGTADSNFSLSYIQNGVENYKKMAAPTADAFKAAITRYTDLKAAYDELNGLITSGLPCVVMESETYSYQYLSATITETWLLNDPNDASNHLYNDQIELTSGAINHLGGEVRKTGVNYGHYNNILAERLTSIETILSTIQAAAAATGNEVYTKIMGCDLTPDNVTVASLNAEYTTLAEKLINGNIAAIKNIAKAYGNKYAQKVVAEATWGPGLTLVGDAQKGTKDGLLKTLENYQKSLDALTLYPFYNVIGNRDLASTSKWTVDLNPTKKDAEGQTIMNERNAASGKIGTCKVNDVTSTTDDTHTADMFCLAVSARWENRYAAWKQTTENTLPAGTYTLTFDVQNPKASKNYQMGNLTYVEVGGKKWYDERMTADSVANAAEWTQHKIEFTLTEESPITISFGYKNNENKGKEVTPELFFSNIQLKWHDLANNNRIISLLQPMKTALDNLEDVCKRNVAAKAAIDAASSDYSKLSKRVDTLQTYVLKHAQVGKTLAADVAPASNWLSSGTYTEFATDLKANLTDKIYEAYANNKLHEQDYDSVISGLDGRVYAFERAVVANANNYENIKAAYSDIYDDIYGKAAVPAVGTVGTPDYVDEQPAILSLDEWLEANTFSPALESWKADVDNNHKYSALKPVLDSIVVNVKTEFEATTLTADYESGRIGTLRQNLSDFKVAVGRVEENHRAQLGYAEAAIDKVLNKQEFVKGCGFDTEMLFDITGEKYNTIMKGVESTDDYRGTVKTENGVEYLVITQPQVLDALEMLQKGLTPINNKIYADYKDLKSDDTDPYIDLLAKVDAYVNGLTGGYEEAVTTYNKDIMAKAMNGQKKKLDDALKDAIALYQKVKAETTGTEFIPAYNEYVDSLMNDGGKIEKNHGYDKLQQFYLIVAKIDEKADKKITEAVDSIEWENGKLKLEKDDKGNLVPVNDGRLELSSFNDLIEDVNNALHGYTDKAGKYVLGVKEYIKGLTEAVNAYAKSYINDKITAANTLVKEQSDLMEQAGMKGSDVQEANAIKNAKSDINKAKLYIYTKNQNTGLATSTPNNYVKHGTVDDCINNMKGALKQLALVEVDAKSEVSYWWTRRYNADENKLQGIGTNLNNWNTTLGNVDFTDYYDAVSANENNKTVALSGTGEITADEAAAVKAAKDVVDQAITKAETLQSTTQNAYNMNVANSNEYEVYTKNGGKLDQLKAKQAEMHTAIGALGLSYTQFAIIPTIAADGAVKTACETVERYKATAYDNRDKIEEAYNKAKTLIQDAYDEAYKVEIQFINKLYTDVRADFLTRYKEEGDVSEELNEIDEAIKNAKTHIDAIIGTHNAQQMAQLLDAETELLGIQQRITGKQGSANDQAATQQAARGVLDQYAADGVDKYLYELDSELSGLDDLIDKVCAFGDWRYTPVPSAEIQEINAGLKAIKTAYYADNNVEVAMGYYEGQMDDLAAAVGADATKGIRAVVAQLKKDAQDAYEVRDTNNKLMKALNDVLDGIDDHYKQICSIIKSYGELKKVNYDELQAAIEQDIADAKDAVSAAAGEYKLADTSKFLYDQDDATKITGVTTTLFVRTSIEGSIKNLIEYATDEKTTAILAEAEKALADAKDKVAEKLHIDQKGLGTALQELIDMLSPDGKKLEATSDHVKGSEVITTCEAVIEGAKALYDEAVATGYILGDIDQNGNVSTNDFTRLVDIILTKTTVAALAERYKVTEEVLAASADANKDEYIGVGDAVKIMRIVNDIDAGVRMMQRTNAAVENSISLVNGQLNLTNGIGVAGMMIDLQGVSAADVTLGVRAAGMSMMTNTLEDGTLRVLILSTDGTMLQGNDGAVLNVYGNARVVKAVISGANGQEFQLAGDEATAIDAIAGAIKNVGEKIYNVGGQLMNGIKKGINIITGEGSAKKVLKK